MWLDVHDTVHIEPEDITFRNIDPADPARAVVAVRVTNPADEFLDVTIALHREGKEVSLSKFNPRKIPAGFSLGTSPTARPTTKARTRINPSALWREAFQGKPEKVRRELEFRQRLAAKDVTGASSTSVQELSEPKSAP